MKLPWRDGPGPLPDSGSEVLFDVVLLTSLGLMLVFTGLDAQVEYAVTQPQSYFLSSASVDGDDSISFTESQVDGLNFATSNRIGFDSVGDEIGLCSGLRSGEVYNLRVAEGFESTSRTSVVFQCAEPRDLTIHSQPGYTSDFSPEDLSYEGEFRPGVQCILYREVAVSPVSGELSGLNCISTDSDDSVTPVVTG